MVFLRQGILMAVPFDLQPLKVRGQPVPLVENVMQALPGSHYAYNTAAGQYAISDSGWLVYVTGGNAPDEQRTLVRVDLKGNTQPITQSKASYFAPRFSPEGQRISYQTLGRNQGVFVYDVTRDTSRRLTEDGGAAYSVWNP